MKSEKLKKFETELADLEQWMQLGLVPKKDLERHKEEMRALHEKIDEEKERLRFAKESGDAEEFTLPKRSPNRPAYAESHTLPDVDGGDHVTETGFDMETEAYDMETAHDDETESGRTEDEGTQAEDEEDEDPFSDRNRWKRGVLEDPESDNW